MLAPVTGVLEYLEFTQLSNQKDDEKRGNEVLEYLEFTQLSNDYIVNYLKEHSFRVPGIYTALKHSSREHPGSRSFRVPGIYTALKRRGLCLWRRRVLEYLEFTQLSNPLQASRNPCTVLEYLEFTQLSNLKFEKSGQ